MTTRVPATKTARQARIADLLESTDVRSQQQLARMLAESGVEVKK